MTNESIKIKVTFRNNEFEVPVNNNFLNVISLHTYCKFNEKQKIAYDILGLKDGEGNQFALEMTPSFGGIHILAIADADKLKDGESYELEFEDIRDTAVERLSNAQIKMIREKFIKIDKDENGYADFGEIKDYCMEIANSSYAQMEKHWKAKIEKNPALKETVENFLDFWKKKSQHEAHIQVALLKEADVNDDGKVSFSEFLEQQAQILVIHKCAPKKQEEEETKEEEAKEEEAKEEEAKEE
mmetsp:Transcript_9819/g.14479  ORF Transcript_9819/g.14479 Transcript_9819/m.14479 type:complete len:242 (+) Transcript_9819:54-779(+)